MRKLVLLLSALTITITLTACGGKPVSVDTSEAPTSENSVMSEITSDEPTEQTTSVSSEPETTVVTTSTSKNTQNPKTESTTTPASSAPSTTTSQPTEPPVTSTPTLPPVAFDPEPYLQYAISYGQSIGLIYEPAIGTGSWNAPQNLYAGLTDENMRKGIRTHCEILIREECEYFYPCLVKVSDGNYQLGVLKKEKKSLQKCSKYGIIMV
jgi:hypothetical protein